MKLLLFEIEELSGIISFAALLSESLLCLESSVFTVFFTSSLFVSSFEETEDLDDDDDELEDDVDDDLELDEDDEDELLRLLLLELFWLEVLR